MKVTLYANYGVLGHEKRPVYHENPICDIYDKIVVEVPDELEPYRCGWGYTMVKLDGNVYPLSKVIEPGKDDLPIIGWYNGSGYRRMKLQIVES